MTHSRQVDHTAQPPPPGRDPSLILLVAALVPIGMSIAAAVTSIFGNDPIVSRTAWVVVAVVGTATMISAAVSLRPKQCIPRQSSSECEPSLGRE